jgi:alkylhydroperoxidase family enzyme
MHSELRLQPIENPKGLMNKVAYWLSRRQFGKVPSVIQVIYARSSPLAMLGYRIQRYTEKGVKLEPSLRLLIQTAVAEVNGCGFCVDIGRAIAIDKNLGMEKFDALPDWDTSPLFSDRERAAIAYAREAGADCRVSDATFEQLRTHFDERGIIDVTSIVAVERFYNGMALPLGLGSDGLCALKLGKMPAPVAA